MSKYRKIDVRVWNDAKFRELSNDAKLVFFLLLTHPNMTALGAMRSTLSGLSEELNMDLEAFREAFREALLKGMVKHDSKACLIALPNFIKYNQPESPNVVKAWANSLDLLPECHLKNEVISISANALKGYSKAFQEALPKTFQEALPKGMPNQEQEQEQEQEQIKHTNNAREVEKTEQEIIDNLTSEPKNFIMQFDWQPNQREFEGYCIHYGIDPKKLTPEILKKFIGESRSNNQKHNESKWCKFLATYLKKWADNPTFEQKPNPHIYQPEQQQPQPQYSDPAYKLFVPLTEEQKRKTPAEDLEKMKALLGGFANE